MILVAITPIAGCMLGLEYVYEDDEPDSWLVLDFFVYRFTFWLGD